MEEEIAHLRSLVGLACSDAGRVLWGRPAPEHLLKHLLFGVLAYRIQADALGDLDAATIRARDVTRADVQLMADAVSEGRTVVW